MSRKVARNAVWSVASTLSSIAVGLVALPVLLHALGAARLGIFTLALGLIGFSGLLDLGLSRSLTQSVSSILGYGRERSAAAALVWYVLRLLVCFGLLWSALLWLIAPLAVERLFSLQGALAKETIFGLRAVALSMPFALFASGAMGSLEGLQCFRQVSARRSILSVVQFGLPTLTALWRADVGWVIGALAVSRACGACAWMLLLRRELPVPWGVRSRKEDIHHLLHFGGWLSVSNLIGPLMVYADRFYLATLFPPAAVAAYTVPYDSLFRVTTVPTAAVSALFPALAEAQSSFEKTVKMVRFASLALVALMLPPMLLGLVFAKFLLTLWLGKAFAPAVLPLFQVLAIGVFVTSAAQVPYAILQASGRSDLTAKLHLLELPVFVGMLVWAVSVWGLMGAALAWTLRVALDAGALYVLAMWLQPACRRVLAEAMGWILLSVVALIIPLISGNPMLLAPTVLLALTLCSAAVLWLYSHWRGSIPVASLSL
jgi:O-antigen/teichoic acid export membrane protein